MTLVEAICLDTLLKKLARDGAEARQALQHAKTLSYDELCRVIELLEELY